MPIKNNSRRIPVVTTATSPSGVEYIRHESFYTEIKMRDTGVPGSGWRQAVSASLPATTPLSGIIEKVSLPDYTMTSGVVGAKGAYTVKGKVTFDPPPMDAVSDTVKARASIDFQSKAAQAMRQFDTGSFIGELSSTIKMVRSPMNSITSLARRHLRRSHSASSQRLTKKELLRAINDSYLEFTFGVKPLLHDIDSLCKAAASITVGNEREFIKASYKETSKTIEIDQSHPMGGEFLPGGARLVGNVSYEHDCRITGAVSLKSVNNNGAAPAFAERFGIGLDQFIPTVYNLIPFSFVVDYFTNVGDYLSAVTNYRCSYAWSNVTYRVTQRSNITLKQVGTSNNPDYWGNISGGTFSSERVYFERSAGLPPVSLSGIYLNVPNAKQILNMASLIASISKLLR